MAGRRGGGGRSRMDLRREAEAAEAREVEEAVKDDDEEVDDEEVDDEDDDAEVDDADLDVDAEADPEADDLADEDDEDSPKPKKKAKKKAVAKVKAPAKKRTRAVKEVRQKAVWVVFDNGGKRVGVFPFPQKADAEQLLAEKVEEKKATFYLQLVKEPIEE